MSKRYARHVRTLKRERARLKALLETEGIVSDSARELHPLNLVLLKIDEAIALLSEPVSAEPGLSHGPAEARDLALAGDGAAAAVAKSAPPQPRPQAKPSLMQRLLAVAADSFKDGSTPQPPESDLEGPQRLEVPDEVERPAVTAAAVPAPHRRQPDKIDAEVDAGTYAAYQGVAEEAEVEIILRRPLAGAGRLKPAGDSADGS